MSWYRTPGGRFRKDVTEGRRLQSDLIVQSAKKCMEAKGVRKTTLVDIAREADITRELIYYYFSGKQEIVDQLVESYIQDAVETARLWCETWDDPNADDEDPLPREAYVDAVASVRRFIRNSDGRRRPMFNVLLETQRYQEFFSRVCSSLVSELGSCGVARRLGATFDRTGRGRGKEVLEFYLAGTIAVIESGGITDDGVVSLLCAREG